MSRFLRAYRPLHTFHGVKEVEERSKASYVIVHSFSLSRNKEVRSDDASEFSEVEIVRGIWKKQS